MTEALFTSPGEQTLLWGNSLLDYGQALVVFIVLWILFRLIQRFLISRASGLMRRTATDLDDTFLRIMQKVRPSVYFLLSFYLGIRTLELSPLVMRTVTVLLIIALVYQVIVSLRIIIDYGVRRRFQRGSDTKDPNAEAAVDMINLLTGVALWSVGLLFVLSNAGVNVTSLVASLGIGGIAVAFALQNVLSDLFSSLAIYLDKPFAIGDSIKVRDVIGTVKHIGIKTTRLKALSGEEVIFSNRELTSAQVNNFGRMERRRVTFKFGVTYDTSPTVLRQIPTLVESLFKDIPKATFRRTHFRAYDALALIFEVVYFVEDPSYTVHMDVRQELNLRLKESFIREKIQFAYATQTVYLNQDS